MMRIKTTSEFNEISKIVGDVPWLTPEGLDLAKFPMDGVLKQALRESKGDFYSALNILRTMHYAGRLEAGVFLLGLLAYSGDDWKMRTEIVQRLRGFHTKGCADFLFGELRRVKSTNTTRRYLAAVLEVLAYMPLELIQSGFLTLIADDIPSKRMRERFEEVLLRARFRESD